MPWKVTFRNDTNNPDIGTASATFTDGAGLFFSTTVERADQKALSVFASTAKAALAAYQLKQATTDAIAAKLEAELNKV